MFSNPTLWSSVGFWILVIGLIGDVIVLFIPSGRAEKGFATLFIAVVIAGVAIEHMADAQRFGPRTLSPSQWAEIGSQLKPFAGTLFTIRSYNDDEGAINLARRIAVMLGTAGWKQVSTGHIMGFLFVRGVSVEIDPRATHLEFAAKALVNSLTGEGIEAEQRNNFGSVAEIGLITIRVGHKPQ